VTGTPPLPLAPSAHVDCRALLSIAGARMVATTGSSAGPGEDEIRRLAEEFDASPEQIREAIDAVGPRPGDIEMHLKGSRSTSNSDRVHDAGG
jgi:hypothetical protein